MCLNLEPWDFPTIDFSGDANLVAAVILKIGGSAGMKTEGCVWLGLNVFDYVGNAVAEGLAPLVELHLLWSALRLGWVVFGRGLAINLDGDFQALEPWNDGHGEVVGIPARARSVKSERRQFAGVVSGDKRRREIEEA